MISWIYVLDDGLGHYKIGRTDNLDVRVRNLGIQLPIKARVALAFQVDDAASAERYFHLFFEYLRCNGEWFRLDRDALDWLSRCSCDNDVRASFLTSCADLARGYDIPGEGGFHNLVRQFRRGMDV